MSILQILIIIPPLLFLYILLIPITISFSIDSSFSRTLKVKMFPLYFRIGTKKSLTANLNKKKIDFERLFFSEFQTLNQIFIAIYKFVTALFKSKCNRLNISMHGGFGSPDITGIVIGMLEAVRPAFGKRVTIVYYPDFMTQSVSGNLSAETVIRGYSILPAVLLLIARLPLLNVVKIFRKIAKGEHHA